jgi:hypothetical protein
MANNLLKRLLDAGVTFGEVTQTKADEILSILKDSGVKRKEAEKTVMDLADQARAQTDKFVARIKSELADQIVAVADRLDDLEDKIEDLAEKAAGTLRPDPVRKTAPTAKPETAAAPAASKRTVAAPRKATNKAVKKAAPRKAAATTKKTVAKKSVAKAPAKKRATKKA